MQYSQDNQNMPANEPVYHVDVPSRKGVLDRPNPELLSSDEQLRILQYYGQIQKTPKNEDEYVKLLFDMYKVGFLNSTTLMSFHDYKDKEEYNLDFEISWLRFLQSIPPGKLSQKVCMYKSQLKRYADELFYRAVGTDKSKTNERISQQMSVFQNISSNMGQGMNPSKGSSFLNRLRSLF